MRGSRILGPDEDLINTSSKLSPHRLIDESDAPVGINSGYPQSTKNPKTKLEINNHSGRSESNQSSSGEKAHQIVV
jgi:hypothetical protein